MRPHDAPAPLGYLFSWLYSVFCHTGGDTLHDTVLPAGLLVLVISKPIPCQLVCGSQHHLGHQLITDLEQRGNLPRQHIQPWFQDLPGVPICLQHGGLHSCWTQLTRRLASLASRQLLHFCEMGKKSKLFALLRHILNSCSFPPLACYFLTQIISLTQFMLQPREAVALAQPKWTVGMTTVSAGRKKFSIKFITSCVTKTKREPRTAFGIMTLCVRQIGERVEGDMRQIIHFLFPVLQNEVLI